MTVAQLTDIAIRAMLSAPNGRGDSEARPAPVALQGAPAQMPPQEPLRLPLGPASSHAFSAETRHFFAAWQAWRGDALLPRRSQVDLVSICKLMSQLSVLEVGGPDRAVFRLAGTEVESQFGMRLTGRSFIKLAQPDQQARRGELVWRLVAQPCAVVSRFVFDRRSGRHDEAEIAAAPVLPDQAGAPVQIFAVLSRLPRQYWGVVDPVFHNSSRNLQFLDIGAGLPARL